MAETTPDLAAYDVVADSYNRWVTDPTPDPTLVEMVGEVRSQRVLSLACGQGRDARMLAALGAEVMGVDISSRLIAHARDHERAHPVGISYATGDARTLAAYQDKSFDGVVCHMALMDISDLRATFESVARVLRPGGWFVFSINHPCFKPPLAGEFLDHATGRTSRVVGGYFTEGKTAAPARTHDALPPHTYHRTLATHLNELVRTGLRITSVLEPAGVANKPVWNEVPCLLYVKSNRA